VIADCRDALRRIDERPRYGGYRFLWGEWLTREQRREADVVWIVDPAATAEELSGVDLPSIKWLVPREAETLRESAPRDGWSEVYEGPRDVGAALDAFRRTQSADCEGGLTPRTP